MRPNLLHVFGLLLAGSLCMGQPPGSATATGTFTGRSGKPMAGAHLMLGRIVGNKEVMYLRLKLLPKTETVADAKGRFQLRGFTPGQYVIVYQPAGASNVFPLEFGIKSLLAVTRSTMPLLKGVEIGKAENYPNRAWGDTFTLLKGHTFLSQGEYMKVFNASIRRNPGGPCMEIRKGLIWIEELADKREVKFEAWSY